MATEPASSPLNRWPALTAPLLLVVGERETSEFVRQTRLLWDAWPGCRPAGASAPLLVPEKHHFSILSDLGNPMSELSKAIGTLFPASFSDLCRGPPG